MLTSDQVRYLACLCNARVHEEYGIPVVISRRDKDSDIQLRYEDFKKNMGLSDPKFHWLCSDKVYIAGGCILNWIWGENTNEDIDFFCKDIDVANNLAIIIQKFQAKFLRASTYGQTFVDADSKSIIQIIGAIDDSLPILPQHIFKVTGTPRNIINGFDFNICKFIIDCDSIYTTSFAIYDLISRDLEDAINGNFPTSDRLAKYTSKNLFLSAALQYKMNSKMRSQNIWPNEY